MDWENALEKNPIQKNENTVKISANAAYEQETTSQFSPFSHFTLNLERKNFMQNHSLLRSTSCFGVAKITTPI